MIQALIGKKLDQTQMFLENGKRVSVTSVVMSDNTVVQVKTAEKDKYVAVQLGYGTRKRPTKALTGHVKKSNLNEVPFLIREIPLPGVAVDALPQAGEKIALETIFAPGDIVDVAGTSKGKGFAGVVKRHNFRGGPKTHGQSDRHRAPGSIGQTTTPGRVYKGKRMAGRMGHETVTIRNLMVLAVDAENDTLLIAGLVPGHKNGLIFVTRRGEDKKFVPLLSVEEPKDASASSEQGAPAEEAQTVSEEVASEAKEEEPKVEDKKDEAPVEDTSTSIDTAQDKSSVQEKKEVVKEPETKKEEAK